VNKENDEAVAIAALIGTDGHSVVGLVYRWYSGGLAVKWSDGPKRVAAVDPELTDAQKREIDFDGLTNIRGERDGPDEV
jgi:hypothetical protein